MKKILVLACLLLLATFSFAQQTSVWAIGDSTTTFGAAFNRGLPRWSIVLERSTGRMYTLTASTASTATLATAAKRKLNIILSELASATWDASDIVSGQFDDARIASSSVTQHEGDLSIDYNQLTNIPQTTLFQKTITDTAYNLTLADIPSVNANMVTVNSNDLVTIYLRDTATFNVPDGKVFNVLRQGAGDVQIKAGGTATILSVTDLLGRCYIRKRYQSVSIYRQKGTNNYIVLGGIKEN